MPMNSEKIKKTKSIKTSNLFKGSRVYLSGPMDFVGSRIIEKYLGWRSILTPILKALGMSVLDPWNKPNIRGHKNYGREGVAHNKFEYEKDFWVNDETRARFETDFWETVHIDLRMTDLSDYVIAFVPTNIYSVGTVHEVITARNQLKPTLLISPPVKYEFFPEIDALSDDVKKILKFYGLKENPQGIPSQWYGNIVGGHYMFDGFGWEDLEFKSPNFYPRLLTKIIDNTEPSSSDKDAFESWKNLKTWIEHYQPLQDLTGGVVDHLKFEPGEKELLETALEHSGEQQRKYFWYNHAYTPQRPLLYHLLNIASGYIPPRLHIVPSLDEEGNIKYRSFEATDDSWLLISDTEK